MSVFVREAKAWLMFCVGLAGALILYLIDICIVFAPLSLVIYLISEYVGR